MTICESHLTKSYVIISGASSCRCIGIAGCLPYIMRELYLGLRENFGYLVKSGGEGALASAFLLMKLHVPS
jgi:hypothetical protein